MLDKLLHKHLDLMDEIEKSAQADIDEIINNMDIDQLIKNPEMELGIAAMAIKKLMIDKHIPKSIEEGFALSKKIKDLSRDIVVPDTNNPNLNEAEVGKDW